MTKLLLIDDDVDIHTLIKEQARTSGIGNIEIISAKNGAEGVKMYTKEAPDIVVMDLRMPEMNGATATKRILRQNPEAKVFILTDYPDSTLATESFNSGAFALVKKAGKFAAVLLAFVVAFTGQ